MKIEGNQKELDAMVEFHKGNRVEGLRLQEEFAAEFRKEYKDKDHCPCLKACRYHGNCKECVAIHRAHQVLSGKLNDAPSGRLFRADFRTLQMCQSL